MKYYSAVHIWMFIHGWLLPDRPRKLTGKEIELNTNFHLLFISYITS